MGDVRRSSGITGDDLGEMMRIAGEKWLTQAFNRR